MTLSPQPIGYINKQRQCKRLLKAFWLYASTQQTWRQALHNAAN